MKPVIISHYTSDTPYEADADHLRRTIEHFGWEHDLEAISDTGSWASNCAAKAELCLRMLEKHPGPVLYLDADCWLNQAPEWFESSDRGDLCLHIQEMDEISRGGFANQYKYHALRRGGMWNSGIVLFRNKPEIKHLVADWIAWCKQRPTVWDQVNLQRAYRSGPKDIRVTSLPADYHAGKRFIGHRSGFHNHWREKHQLPQRDLLLMGSAPSAPGWWEKHGQDYVNKGYSICAFNNAWRVIPDSDLEYWFFPNDFDGERPPREIPRNENLDVALFGSNLNPTKNWLIQPYWEPEVRLTLIDTCYHLLNQAAVDGVNLNVHLVATDLVYPRQTPSHFYGEGRPDPLRYNSRELDGALRRLHAAYQAEGYTIFNASREPETRLPFPRAEATFSGHSAQNA